MNEKFPNARKIGFKIAVWLLLIALILCAYNYGCNSQKKPCLPNNEEKGSVILSKGACVNVTVCKDSRCAKVKLPSERNRLQIKGMPINKQIRYFLEKNKKISGPLTSLSGIKESNFNSSRADYLYIVGYDGTATLCLD